MLKLLKNVFCRHGGGLTFVRNIYGDEINAVGGKRSEWRCNRCEGLVLRGQLNPELQRGQALQSQGSAAGLSRSAAPAPAMDDILSNPLHPLNPWSPLSTFNSLYSSPAPSPCPAPEPAESRCDWGSTDYGSSSSGCDFSSDSGSSNSID